jgi:hypothetical protein
MVGFIFSFRLLFESFTFLQKFQIKGPASHVAPESPICIKAQKRDRCNSRPLRGRGSLLKTWNVV